MRKPRILFLNHGLHLSDGGFDVESAGCASSKARSNQGTTVGTGPWGNTAGLHGSLSDAEIIGVDRVAQRAGMSPVVGMMGRTC